ncbi:hypothetical protein ANCCAN_25068 [Ancylostoma caninum]|uniref:Peptidase A1 domain-containing protein n=1 Tax=Ancylostoma caninum TaxID=29170 RepID=A0A368FC41_ANCCA|nr:hypothetical protein ANCCAN_25068 [Ancylostoma caninum]
MFWTICPGQLSKVNTCEFLKEAPAAVRTGKENAALKQDRRLIERIDGTQLSIPNITFGLATSLEIEEGQGEADGVLGLAFVPYEGTNSDPFITSAFKKGISRFYSRYCLVSFLLINHYTDCDNK